jgi:hypothetical protein
MRYVTGLVPLAVESLRQYSSVQVLETQALEGN